MIKIYLVLLIGIALASTDYKFYDINYNTEYEVDISYFGQYLPANFHYFFRLSVEPDDKMQIQLKVLKNAIIDFHVDICGFQTFPDSRNIFFGNPACVRLKNTRSSYDSYYDKYLYDFETATGIYYLGVHLENLASLHYLSVYVHSAKGSYIALILILIFLPCIIIAAIVIFCLRRCGIITIGVSSNKI